MTVYRVDKLCILEW